MFVVGEVWAQGEGQPRTDMLTLSSNAAVERIFSEPFLLMTIADSPLLGHSASGLNFWDEKQT